MVLVNKEDTLPTASIKKTKLLARLGDNIQIACEVTGTPNPRVYWTKDQHQQVISEEAVLMFTSITGAHSGEYHCHAQNRKGESRVSIILEVIGKILCNITVDLVLALPEGARIYFFLIYREFKNYIQESTVTLIKRLISKKV